VQHGFEVQQYKKKTQQKSKSLC